MTVSLRGGKKGKRERGEGKRGGGEGRGERGEGERGEGRIIIMEIIYSGDIH